MLGQCLPHIVLCEHLQLQAVIAWWFSVKMGTLWKIFFSYFLDVMVDTLQPPGTSGPKRGWSPEASTTPTLVSFVCETLIQWLCLCLCVVSPLLTQSLCLQVVGPTPSPPASTMWMAADPPALGRVVTHPSASTSVKLDTHPATNRTSTLVRNAEEKSLNLHK